MNTSKHLTSIISLLLLTGLYASSTSADLVNGTHWVIKSGDSLYKISRNIFPGNAKKQQELRKALIANNPDVFKGNASNISVGDKLQLPSFAITKKKTIPHTTAKPVVTKPVTTKKIKNIASVAPVKKAQTKKTTKHNSQDVIGQVVINVGELSAENRGARRLLNRRSKILRGDTISTGAESHTQIRMKDGALLSLRPYTNLKISNYRYNGRQDGTEQSIIELLKGGFRTITGAIGHINKQTYKVKTSVATIGIRGTHYTLMLCDDDCRDDSGKHVKAGLYGGVSDGAVVVENQTGIHRFNNDQFFQVISARARPIEFIKPPGILKNAPQKIAKAKKKLKKIKAKLSNKFKAKHRRLALPIEPNQPDTKQRPPLPVADLNTDSTPVTAIEPQRAPDGSAMLIGFNHLNATSVTTGTAAPVIISPVTGNDILLTDYELPDSTVVGKVPYAAKEFSADPQGVIVHDLVMTTPNGDPAVLDPSSIGGDPTLGVNWGRWNGQFTVLEDGQPLTTSSDFHYIYSENVTSPTQLASLSGLVASYNMAGGTLPTDDLGNVALPGNTSVSMGVNFSTQLVTSYDVSTVVAGNSYQASANNIPIQDLNRSFAIQSVSVGCTTSCIGEASVVFVGDQAQGALNSYAIQDISGAPGKAITGTALLVRP